MLSSKPSRKPKRSPTWRGSCRNTSAASFSRKRSGELQTSRPRPRPNPQDPDMRTTLLVIAGASLALGATDVRAQTALAPLSPLELRVACAPPASFVRPNALVPHVLG